jgi:hypothetical protein
VRAALRRRAGPAFTVNPPVMNGGRDDTVHSP